MRQKGNEQGFGENELREKKAKNISYCKSRKPNDDHQRLRNGPSRSDLRGTPQSLNIPSG